MAKHHYKDLQSFEKKKYRVAYRRGFVYSESLDIEDHKGLDGNPYGGGYEHDAWEDGYMDHAVDRGWRHRQICTEDSHDTCELTGKGYNAAAPWH